MPRFTIAVFLFAFACARQPAGDQPPPDGPPAISGAITAVQSGALGSADRLATVLIEENPNDQSGSAKASLRVTRSTIIQQRDSRGTISSASVAELAAGRRAAAWFTGPVMESYPVQVQAARIVLLP